MTTSQTDYVTTVARLHFEETVIEHRRQTETPKDRAHADLLIKLSPRARQDWLGVHLRQTKADQGVFDPVEKDFQETCPTCSDKGQNQCTNCRGVGERTCTACSYGKINCGTCSGRGKRRCDICYGNGSTRQRVHVRNNFKADGGWDEVWEDQNVTCNACHGAGCGLWRAANTRYQRNGALFLR